MSETKNTGDKTLTAKPKTLTLKRPVEQGMVRQSFSHGRSKAVVVEKVKRRTVGAAAEPVTKAEAPVSQPKTVQTAKPASKTPSGRAARGSATPASPGSSEAPAAAAPAAPGVVLRTLTEEEREARAKALIEARERELEARKQAEIEAKERAEREAREKVERDAAAARKADEEARRSQDAEAKRKAAESAAKRLSGGPPEERPPASEAKAPARPN